MKNLIYVCVVVAVVSLVIGIISRINLAPVMFGLEANALLRFTDTCLLLAIALGLIQMLKSKQ